MKTESGRSLIEIIGVLALTAIMTAGAVKLYSSIRTNQAHTIAAAELREIAKDTKLLFDMRDDYAGVSVDYLLKAGAIKKDNAPLGNAWAIEPFADQKSFAIKLFDLGHSDCEFFALSVPQWASDVIVNNHSVEDNPQCFSGNTNNVFFIVE